VENSSDCYRKNLTLEITHALVYFFFTKKKKLLFICCCFAFIGKPRWTEYCWVCWTNCQINRYCCQVLFLYYYSIMIIQGFQLNSTKITSKQTRIAYCIRLIFVLFYMTSIGNLIGNSIIFM